MTTGRGDRHNDDDGHHHHHHSPRQAMSNNDGNSRVCQCQETMKTGPKDAARRLDSRMTTDKGMHGRDGENIDA
jgi:hypothetical protein